jgi:hypothetical protein
MTGDSHRPPRSGCAINAAIEVLGDPWSMLVPREVIFGDRRHLRELLQGSKERTASNILSSRLKRLVAVGPAHPGGGDVWAAGGVLTDRRRHPGPPGHGRDGQLGPRPPRRHRELRVPAQLLGDGGPELIERFMDKLPEAHLGSPLSDPDRPRASEQRQAAYEAPTTGGLDQ